MFVQAALHRRQVDILTVAHGVTVVVEQAVRLLVDEARK